MKVQNLLPTSVAQALETAWEQLGQLASSDLLFRNAIATALGESADPIAFQTAWANGDFSSFPSIEIRSTSEIRGANGAFAADTGKIYLAQEFVDTNVNNPGAITAILLEEYGHYLDSQVNVSDRPGDEGEIFARLVQGERIREPELAILKAEDDTATVTLDRPFIEIEQSTLDTTADEDNYTNYAEPRLSQQSNTIKSLLSKVSQKNIGKYVGDLSEEPRYTPQQQSAAAEYIIDTLEGFDYEVTLDPITAAPSSPGNIIAQLPGKINPDTKFIIGAHYDSVEESPGADDNASAVAGTLEIARVLQNFQPDATIEFVLFGAEEEDDETETEENTRGSQQYAIEAAEEEVAITGMFSLEMIGYFSDRPNSQVPFSSFDLDFSTSPPQVVPPGTGTPALRVSEENRTTGDFIAAVGNSPQSDEFLEAFQTTSNALVKDLNVITAKAFANGNLFPQTRRSDHAPFWDNGYEALMLTDTANFRNPNYHQPTDTIETLDLTFAKQVTQAALATAIITTSVLVVDGTNGQGSDNLFGTSRADEINGGNEKDILTGLAGHDIVNGGNGQDILTGVDPSATHPGYGEIDTLNGGNGKDIFVLGDSNNVYYNNPDTSGLKDYALIIDYSKNDAIQLNGSPSNYTLAEDVTIGSSTGTGIFSVSEQNDLIGLVEGVTGLELNSSYFNFV